MPKKTRSFSASKAAKLSRGGRVTKALLKPLMRNLPEKAYTNLVVTNIAQLVLKKIPVDTIKYSGPVATKKRFGKSFSMKAERALSTPGNSVSSFHCVERCTVALALMRKAKIPCWLARQVVTDYATGKRRVHDFVEYFANGKIQTLGFGFDVRGRSDFVRYPHVSDKIVAESGAVIPISFVLRGIDSSQIAGVTSQKKLKRFLKNPSSGKELLKNSRRLKLLVESGVMPKEAYNQIIKLENTR